MCLCADVCMCVSFVVYVFNGWCLWACVQNCVFVFTFSFFLVSFHFILPNALRYLWFYCIRYDLSLSQFFSISFWSFTFRAMKFICIASLFPISRCSAHTQLKIHCKFSIFSKAFHFVQLLSFGRLLFFNKDIEHFYLILFYFFGLSNWTIRTIIFAFFTPSHSTNVGSTKMWGLPFAFYSNLSAFKSHYRGKQLKNVTHTRKQTKGNGFYI